MVRRFARLWPVHAAMLLVLALFVLALDVRRGYQVPSVEYSFAHFPLELAMLRSWYSDVLVWNFPAWSIHAEWFAYLFIFPLGFVMFRDARAVRVLVCSLATLLGMSGLPQLAAVPGVSLDITFLFLAGCVLYRLRVLLPKLRGNWSTNAGVVLFATGIYSTSVPSQLLLHISFALLIFGLSYQSGMIARLLALRPIVYGGQVSYSLYMSHEVVHKLFGTAISSFKAQTDAQRVAIVIALLTTTTLAACACYHLVEVPCNLAIRQRMRRYSWAAAD